MDKKKMSETEFQYLSKKGASNFKAAQSNAKKRSSVKKNFQTAMDIVSAPAQYARGEALKRIAKKGKKK